MEDHPTDQPETKSIVDDLKNQAQALMDRGKKRSETLIQSRRRNELLKELGAAVYEARPDGDDVIDLTVCDDLFARLDELDAADQETPTT